MYGSLRRALAGRQIAYQPDSFRASVQGRIVGVGPTIRIRSIHVHYDLAVPPEARAATERALEFHPRGCPAHQSVREAITVTWDAALQVGEETVRLEGGDPGPA